MTQRHRWMELVTTLDHVEAPERLTLRLVLKHAYYPTLMELAQVRPLRFASPQAKRFILTTLHEQAVYLPISHLTAISVRRDSVAKVQFGSTLFDVPFETMTPKQGD
ncbi:hypothetical protein [Pseudomonas putida]|uniref:Uncharacterized protein n=1 Tax=Pseudomonas putida TaxID=303 RepID=A0AAW5HMG7_PSEPU|nr:hypothetical protein [Pseudomonas putida]MCO1623341.1 hypothetical protein [Pseudomonas putida]